MKEKRNILSLINIIISGLVLIGLIILLIINFNKKDANDIFRDTYESIVEIKVTEGEDIGYGSGVIISDDGKIITNSHVIIYEENNLFDKVEIILSYEEEYKEVSVVKYDSDKDLALLKLDNVVRQFQRDNGLVVDGIVGKNTWNKLKILGGGRS